MSLTTADAFVTRRWQRGRWRHLAPQQLGAHGEILVLAAVAVALLASGAVTAAAAQLASSAPQSCLPAVMEMKPERLSLTCGPLMFPMPAGRRWSDQDAQPRHLTAWLDCCARPPLGITVGPGPGRPFDSAADLARYVEATILPTKPWVIGHREVTLPAGREFLIRGRRDGKFYEDYWLLHKHRAYSVQIHGTVAYESAHQAEIGKLLRTIRFDNNDRLEAYGISYVTYWSLALAGKGMSRVDLELVSVGLPVTPLPWSIDLRIRVPEGNTFRLKAVSLIVSGALTSGTGLERWAERPFTLVGAHTWENFLNGIPNRDIAGDYGAIKVDYVLDGDAGSHTFPALARAGCTHPGCLP